MKTLYLIRHAKSDWNAGVTADHERPLNQRGVRSARQMGRFLSAAGEVPGAALASSALRARTTFELMAAAGGWTCPVRITNRFYETGPADVLAEVRGESDEHASLLLVGHEPTWSGLVRALTGGRARMPTAGLARIDLQVERWAEVASDAAVPLGTLVFFVTPKLLEAAGWEPR